MSGPAAAAPKCEEPRTPQRAINTPELISRRLYFRARTTSLRSQGDIARSEGPCPGPVSASEVGHGDVVWLRDALTLAALGRPRGGAMSRPIPTCYTTAYVSRTQRAPNARQRVNSVEFSQRR